MAKKQAAPKVDAKDIADANIMWGNFITLSKYSIIATVAILVLMAVFLL